jgi:hypothetical protein
MEARVLASGKVVRASVRTGVPVIEQVPPPARPDAMNEPHENLDNDPFADDARRRRSRLRRQASGAPRGTRRRRCAVTAVPARRARIQRPCPRGARGPLREWR